MSDHLSPEQVVRRICVLIERCDRAMGEELLGQLPEVPLKVRLRMMNAINQFRDKLIQNGLE